jgi:hypothetical protein
VLEAPVGVGKAGIDEKRVHGLTPRVTGRAIAMNRGVVCGGWETAAKMDRGDTLKKINSE